MVTGRRFGSDPSILPSARSGAPMAGNCRTEIGLNNYSRKRRHHSKPDPRLDPTRLGEMRLVHQETRLIGTRDVAIGAADADVVVDGDDAVGALAGRLSVTEVVLLVGAHVPRRHQPRIVPFKFALLPRLGDRDVNWR